MIRAVLSPGNGLSSVWRQVITQTNADLSSIRLQERYSMTFFLNTNIFIEDNVFEIAVFKVSVYCLGLKLLYMV